MAEQENNLIHSKNIIVYPTTTRQDVFDPLSRLTTEYNITSIINRLVGLDAFVISKIYETPLFEFNIMGYYFALDGSSFRNLVANLYDGKYTFVNDNTSDIVQEWYLNATIRVNKAGHGDIQTNISDNWRQLTTVDTGKSQMDSYEYSASDYDTSQYYGLKFDVENTNTFSYYTVSNEYLQTDPRYFKTDGTGRLISNVKITTSGNAYVYKFTLLKITFIDSKNNGATQTLVTIPDDSRVRFNQDMINYQHIVSGPSQITIDDGVL